MLHGALFDLDGTLIDTAGDFVVAVNRLRAARGLTAMAASRIAEQVSNGAAALTQLALGIPPEQHDFELHRQALLNHYRDCLGEQARLYDGLDSLLEQLDRQGSPWGVVTNKPLAYALPLMKSLGLAERCHALICPEHVSHKKPDPEPLQLAADKLQLDSRRLLYTGDHARDIIAARAAGMTSIAAGYGYIEATQNPVDWRADHLVDSSQQLQQLILSLITAAPQ